jgi:protein-S-isoprenylcysteine O-methyltransferase Ste14
MKDTPADAPRVIALPPLLFAATLVLGLLLHVLMPVRPLPVLPARVLGGVLLVTGLSIARWGERTMRRAGTNSRPNQPTLAIVTDGPFRFSRNPLYLATTGAYLGIALVLDALWPLVLVVPLLAVIHWGVVRREEAYLEEKFGQTYLAYKAQVRRWI